MASPRAPIQHDKNLKAIKPNPVKHLFVHWIALIFLWPVFALQAGDNGSFVTLEIAGKSITLERDAFALLNEEGALDLMAIGSMPMGMDHLRFHLSQAKPGTFTHKDTPKLWMEYCSNGWSSDSNDTYLASGDNPSCVLELTITQLGHVGGRVEGTFRGKACSHPDGRELLITNGRFSVIRKLPKTRP